MLQDQKLGRKVNVYANIGAVGVLVFLVQRILDGSLYLAIVLSCALSLIVAARLLIHLKKSPALAGHFITLGAFISIAGPQIKEGGFDSHTLWLVSIVPLIAGDLLGPRGIPGYFLLSALSISAPWLTQFTNLSYPEPHPLEPLEVVFIRIIGAITVTAVCVHVAKEYDGYVVELASNRGEIFKTHQEAEALNQEKTSFLRQMSREIRAPLNGIKGMTQVWVRQPQEKDIAEAVGTMDRCANNLLSIINDAQDLSQIGEHQFEINAQPFSISQMVHDIVLLFQGKAQKKNIDLVAFGSSEECFGVGDQKRLTQVLSNLIGNAIKFSDEGRVELRWRWLDPPTTSSPSRIKFEVSDEGIGMSKSQVDSLFTEFTQVHEDESVRRGGTGLGLAISKSLVESMGGTLKVDSQAGRGSCFRIEMPMTMSTIEDIEATTQEKADQAQLNSRVLLLDDDLASLWVQRLALEGMGCKVECARNAASALALAERKSFDLAIFDLRMPDITGIQALEKLREQPGENAGIPAIALTASAEPEDKQACLAAGFKQVLVKPFDYQELKDAISNHGKQSSVHNELERAS